MLTYFFNEILRSDDSTIKKVLHLLQLGQYQFALDEFIRNPDATNLDYGALLKEHLRRCLANRIGCRSFELVWQIDPNTWETDWIRYLFGAICSKEHVDRAYQYKSDCMIVVDNRLTFDKILYYRSLYLSGVSVVLIHLSDEGFHDDLGVYMWCNLVFRNYLSPTLSGISDIVAFPLGFKSGLNAQTMCCPTERPYLWSFAGDANKANRKEMLTAMELVGPGKVHLTSGFNASDALSTRDYRALLDMSVFAPCPAGYVNLESFRIWEALECGAIPVIEGRRNFDYLTAMVGSHPLLVVESWSDVHHQILRLTSERSVSSIQAECLSWWRNYKLMLQSQIASRLMLS